MDTGGGSLDDIQSSREEKEAESCMKYSEADTEDEEEDEGSHMTCLRQALDKTVHRCVDAARLSMFKHCFPEVAKTDMTALQAINKNYQEQLTTAIKNEINVMFKEEKLPELMKSLDDMIAQAPKNLDHPAWRPTGDPHNDVRAHYMEVKLKQKAKLEQFLSELNSENKKLASIRSARQQKLFKAQEKAREKDFTFEQCAEHIQEINKVVEKVAGGPVNSQQNT